MSKLPPALAARLAARGILRSTESQDNLSQNRSVNAHEELPHHHEEVIAEDYDEPQKTGPFAGEQDNSGSKQLINNKKGYVAPGCPNKSNIYHDCGDYCEKKWGVGQEVPSEEIKRKFRKILKRYPLPEGWVDVWDPGMATFYFWNHTTDEVSWLPPLHPKASVSVSAEKMKSLMRDDEEHQEDDQPRARKRRLSESEPGSGSGSSSEDESDESDYSSESDSSSEDSDAKRDRRSQPSSTRFLGSQSQDRQERGRNRGRQVRSHNTLDPMDPASYSDIPRGKWSDGLEAKGDAKSGVDPTASGPLYQQRPLPAPGAILRMNSGKN